MYHEKNNFRVWLSFQKYRNNSKHSANFSLSFDNQIHVLSSLKTMNFLHFLLILMFTNNAFDIIEYQNILFSFKIRLYSIVIEI